MGSQWARPWHNCSACRSLQKSSDSQTIGREEIGRHPRPNSTALGSTTPHPASAPRPASRPFLQRPCLRGGVKEGNKAAVPPPPRGNRLAHTHTPILSHMSHPMISYISRVHPFYFGQLHERSDTLLREIQRKGTPEEAPQPSDIMSPAERSVTSPAELSVTSPTELSVTSPTEQSTQEGRLGFAASEASSPNRPTGEFANGGVESMSEISQPSSQEASAAASRSGGARATHAQPTGDGATSVVGGVGSSGAIAASGVARSPPMQASPIRRQNPSASAATTPERGPTTPQAAGGASGGVQKATRGNGSRATPSGDTPGTLSYDVSLPVSPSSILPSPYQPRHRWGAPHLAPPPCRVGGGEGGGGAGGGAVGGGAVGGRGSGVSDREGGGSCE